MSQKHTFTKNLYSDLDTKRIVVPEKAKNPSESYRSPFRKDYSRLLHSPSFRRLQGKTQLFPNHENDFYRNRLTHSLEVAQIAKSIALKINNEFLENEKIDLDIIEFACLAHDLGHPPFGHNGEMALDEKMREAFGGFEGNAQTFRIISKLEKKVTKKHGPNGEYVAISDGKDVRAGLNVTARSLAATLKYDSIIPPRNNDRGSRKDKLYKGYYDCDSEIVDEIKRKIVGEKYEGAFKTIECQIMDIADDIAYSTYDLEDAFKAGFLNPMKLISLPDKIYKDISKEIQKDLKEYDPNKFKTEDFEFAPVDVVVSIVKLFEEVFDQDGREYLDAASSMHYISEDFAQNGYLRTDFTSVLVGKFIDGIIFEPNDDYPALSKVFLHPETFKVVETLKKISYKSLIMSPMLKVSEYRGKKIIKDIFDVLEDQNGYLLMPKDYQELYKKAGDETFKKRIICDFIAGMTDRYAMEFYNRLFGTNPQTMHKPF